MALINVVAGAYTGVFTAPYVNDFTQIGLLTERGYELAWTIHGRPINDTTSYANSLIDGIYLGADWNLIFVAREFLFGGALDAFWPFGTIGDVRMDAALPIKMGYAGQRWRDRAGTIILTAVTGTPADGNPATLTAEQAIVAPGSYRFAMTSKIRELPINLMLLPVEGGSELVTDREQFWFETT